MITVRQIQRVWDSGEYDRLVQQLLTPRAEGGSRAEQLLAGAVPAAALAVIRLDELTQSYVPLYGQLLRVILNAQRPDGGWGEPIITAVCLRALLCGGGNGAAVDLGLEHLARIQKEDGLWPNPPLRRMPADPYASAFILLQLGDRPDFRAAVRFAEAVDWFGHNGPMLDGETAKLWTYAARRCGNASATAPARHLFAAAVV
jgi:hypothetical protein